jgi:uncharacterized protein
MASNSDADADSSKQTEPVERTSGSLARLWRSPPANRHGRAKGSPVEGVLMGRSANNRQKSTNTDSVVSAAGGSRVARIIKDLATVFLVYVVGQVSVGLLVGFFGHGASQTARTSTVLVAYMLGGILMIAALLYMIKLRKIPRASVLYFKKPKLGDIGLVFLGYGMYFAVVTVVLILIKAYVPAIDLAQKQELGLQSISGAMLPLTFVALAILPPLSEEMMFRGFLLSRLRSHKLSKWVSAIVVSGLFGLSHGQVNVAIDTFVLSMVMIYVLGLRRNLWITVGIHMLKNALAFLGLFVFKVF